MWLISCVSSGRRRRDCCVGSPVRPALGSRTSNRACRCTGAPRRTDLRSGTRTLRHPTHYAQRLLAQSTVVNYLFFLDGLLGATAGTHL